MSSEADVARSRSFAQRADALADRVNRNSLSRTNSPESFHAEKSDIAIELRKLSRDLRGEVRIAPSTTWRPAAAYRNV